MGILTAKIEYGSVNYNLNVEESDHDFKLLYTPTFDELYHSKVLNGVALPPQLNPLYYSTMDVRHYTDLLRKCNPNAIEFLFSTNTEYMIDDWRNVEDTFRTFFKSGYVANGWLYFTSAIRGLVLNTFKRMGVNGKTCSRAYYFYGLVEHIYNTDFVVNEDVLRAEIVTRFARAMRIKERTTFNADVFTDVYDKLINKIGTPEKRCSEDIFTEQTKAFVEKHIYKEEIR